MTEIGDLVEKEAAVIGFAEISDHVRGQKMLAQLRGEIAHAARISILGL
jgi:hypothetical protein